MKTKTVKFIEVCQALLPDVGYIAFFFIAMFGYAGMLTDLSIVYGIIFSIVIPAFVLHYITGFVSLYFETLPAKHLIIDQKTSMVIQKPFDQPLRFLPFIDKRLMRLKYGKIIKIRFDGHGELIKNPNWLNAQLESFRMKPKSLTSSYASPRSWKQSFTRSLKRAFRKSFSGELDLSYENF